MSRLLPVAVAVYVVALALAAPASAQSKAMLSSSSLAVRPLSGLVAESEANGYAVRMTPVAPAKSDEEEGHVGALGLGARALVGVVGGAVVGGWLGYFGAQVGRSDWARVTDTEKSSLRRSYMVSGAGVGAFLGYFMRPRVRATSRLPQPIHIPARTGRQLLMLTELRRSIATNALEAVELGRPEWTKQQRDDEALHATSPRTGPIETISVVVYVGEERVGGIETLRDMGIPEVAELRFYEPRDAKRRWGVEHRYGAIEVVPASTASAMGLTDDHTGAALAK
jgi:hypothetical protein